MCQIIGIFVAATTWQAEKALRNLRNFSFGHAIVAAMGTLGYLIVTCLIGVLFGIRWIYAQTERCIMKTYYLLGEAWTTVLWYLKHKKGVVISALITSALVVALAVILTI